MIDSTGEPSFCARSAMIMPAKKTPESTPKVSPKIFPAERPSARNNPMPASATKMVTQSIRRAFSAKKSEPNNAIQTGAPY